MAGAGGVYALTTALWPPPPLGVLAAVVLLYTPHVFQLNIYKRGDIPEALALALIPYLLLAPLRPWLAPAWGTAMAWTVASTAVGAAIVLTHNLTALLAGAIAVLWVMYPLVVRRAGSLDEGHRCRAGSAGADHVLLASGHRRGSGSAAGGAAELRGLDYRGWFIEPNGRSPRQQSEHNRATRSGLVDWHLHTRDQLVSPPMISWSQAGPARWRSAPWPCLVLGASPGEVTHLRPRGRTRRRQR